MTIEPLTIDPPRYRLCQCGEWWLPLHGDTAATCLRCDREYLDSLTPIPTVHDPLGPLMKQI